MENNVSITYQVMGRQKRSHKASYMIIDQEKYI